MGKRFEVIAWTESPIGMFDLRRREVPTADGSETVYEVLVNDELLMSSRNNVSEIALATRALASHEGAEDLSVLVGGLGLGYTARAALTDRRVTSVRVVDLVPVLFDWLSAGLLPLSGELHADPRFEAVIGNVYAKLLRATDEIYDVILIDVDHTPRERLDESSAPFYRAEGQRRVANHLRPGGVIAVWSAAEDDRFATVLEEVYDDASWERVEWEDPYLGVLSDVLFVARKAGAGRGRERSPVVA